MDNRRCCSKRCISTALIKQSKTKLGASDSGKLLTKFTRNIEARVFAVTRSGPPQEMNENYGLPVGGRPDM